MRDRGKRRGKLPEGSVGHYEKELVDRQSEVAILAIQRLRLYWRRIQFNPGCVHFLKSRSKKIASVEKISYLIHFAIDRDIILRGNINLTPSLIA